MSVARTVLRLLSCLVIASSAVIVWTRAALVYAYGAQQVNVFLWIAAGGTLCAVVTLIRTRRRIPQNAGNTRNDQARGGA